MKSEFVGASMHDGMRFEVPDNVVALVVITPGPDGGYDATLGRVNSATISVDEITDALFRVVLSIPEGTA